MRSAWEAKDGKWWASMSLEQQDAHMRPAWEAKDAKWASMSPVQQAAPISKAGAASGAAKRKISG
jgi:hypothetical protein